MFATFTGSSRRARNVNLSGQLPAASGRSSVPNVISHAQAERQQRQLERQRLASTKTIQRVWRGYQARSHLRQRHRAAFDELYRCLDGDSSTTRERSNAALPLLLIFFRAQSPGDVRRLIALTSDIVASRLNIDLILNFRLSKFGNVLMDALDTLVSSSDGQALDQAEQLLIYILQLHEELPGILCQNLNRYYKVLLPLCSRSVPHSQVVLQAILAPLVPPPHGSTSLSKPRVDTIDDAYASFALALLTNPNLSIVYGHLEEIAKTIDTIRLSTVIVSESVMRFLPLMEVDRQLNLLAHFIDLTSFHVFDTKSVVVIVALNVQLSFHIEDIKLRLSQDGEEWPLRPLLPYVKHKLLSLVGRDRLAGLVMVFFQSNVSASQSRDGLPLVEFALTLLRCFPAHGDELRMPLIRTLHDEHGNETSYVKLLWRTVSQTKLLGKVLGDSDSAIKVLREYLKPEAPSFQVNCEFRAEWSTLLLFLELYTFVLRISDDEDFLSGMQPQGSEVQLGSSRLRSCSLQKADVTQLSLFLKALSFALYYNTAQILPREDAGSGPDRAVAVADIGSGHAGTAVGRLDIGSLRDIFASAIRMLYERDSRRQFLPKDHWLMVSKFSMDGFLDDVVAEERRMMDSDDSDDGALPVGPVEMRRNNRRRRARLNEMQKQMRHAEVGPKLEILRNMPYVIPFETRVKLFRRFVRNDKLQRRNGSVSADLWRLLHHEDESHRATVRRGYIFEDAFVHYWKLGDGLKEPIQITFVDRFGEPELGIDGGGVTKEFLTCVVNEAFSLRTGVVPFVANTQGQLYPNPSAVDEQLALCRSEGLPADSLEASMELLELLNRYEFLGRIVGKCLYEGILIDVSFASFFLLKWAAVGQTGQSLYRGSLNDLLDMDEAMYQGLLQLKNYTGDVQDMSLDFSLDDKISLAGQPLRTVTRSLVPGGQNTPVTNDNRLLYVSYVARHRLVSQPARQTTAFIRGLRAIINPRWLSMFNQLELQRLVGGDSQAIDLADLRRNTVCLGLYDTGHGPISGTHSADHHESSSAEHPTIQLFWRVMAEFDDAQRRDVVKYVTSTPRAPLLGFSLLEPLFSIRDAGADTMRLPSASTCVNLLKLPVYIDQHTLRQKLLLAVTSGAGFDLS